MQQKTSSVGLYRVQVAVKQLEKKPMTLVVGVVTVRCNCVPFPHMLRRKE